jgi:hypothetical protein
LSNDSTDLKQRLAGQGLRWLQARAAGKQKASDLRPTEQALDRFERLWGADELSAKFRELLKQRGLSLYDRKIEHHYTGSAIIVDPTTRKVLLTFHP